MLQQTQVTTVIPYYQAFLKRFPTVAKLAAADADTVRSMWSGLGYYRRAQAMMRAADRIVCDHGGQLPDDPEALRKLPGFGAYTTGAVASIAFGKPIPAVDGNVNRVISRLDVIREDPNTAKIKRQITQTVQELLDLGSPPDLTQALMELGATVCTPRNPSCDQCPLREECSAHEQGVQSELPFKKPKKKRPIIKQRAVIHYASSPRRVWLVKQPEDGLFAGLFLPRREDSSDTDVDVRHQLTHKELWFSVRGSTQSAPAHKDGRWVELEALSQLGLPSLTLKLLRAGVPANWIDDLPRPGRQRGPSGG